MKYSIVSSRLVGNTGLLTETVQKSLPAEDCIYCGEPSEKALAAERIYVGFWTDKGSCDEAAGAFLETLRDKEVFLFGSAGFGGDPAYFADILEKVRRHLDPSVHVSGTFMCQGKMRMAVRERYEKMLAAPDPDPDLQRQIDNFDRALTHPDADDLRALTQAVQS